MLFHVILHSKPYRPYGSWTMGPKTCTIYSSHAVMELGWASAMPSLFAILELVRHRPCHHYMQFPSLWHMCHALSTCSSGAWAGICHTLVTCSPGALETYIKPSLHAVSELATYMPCPQYRQFWRLRYISHASITCSSRIYGPHAMPSLNAISELAMHTPCPQLLLCTTLYYFVLLHITLHSKPHRPYEP